MNGERTKDRKKSWLCMHDEGENIVQEKGKKTQKGLFTLHKTYRK